MPTTAATQAHRHQPAQPPKPTRLQQYTAGTCRRAPWQVWLAVQGRDQHACSGKHKHCISAVPLLAPATHVPSNKAKAPTHAKDKSKAVSAQQRSRWLGPSCNDKHKCCAAWSARWEALNHASAANSTPMHAGGCHRPGGDVARRRQERARNTWQTQSNPTMPYERQPIMHVAVSHMEHFCNHLLQSSMGLLLLTGWWHTCTPVSTSAVPP